MPRKDPIDLKSMDRAFFEGLDASERLELLCRLHAMAVELAERINQNSTNASRPPSSDSPFKGPLPGLGGPLPGKPGASKPASGQGSAASSGSAPSDPKRKPGKQPGAKGIWRSEALIHERTEDHYPSHCEPCGQPLELWFAHEGASAHRVLELERQTGGVRIACVKHRCLAVTCTCGAKTAARPLTGGVRILEGRKGQLRPSEAGLVGPGLTTFIAALSVPYRMSRAKIAEFLSSWLDVRLYRSAASIAASARRAWPVSRSWMASSMS